jgi:hypothetical protein
VPAPPGSYPSITNMQSNELIFWQMGNDDDAYWLHDNQWGKGSITNYYQQVGRMSRADIGPNGEVAFRLRGSWPNEGPNEVKAYPSAIIGRKPGYYSAGHTPGGHAVLNHENVQSFSAPSGWTPGSFFPISLPMAGSLKAYADFTHIAPPTGRGHLAFDIWLQEFPTQDGWFRGSSITHEIMIPLTNWGGYASLDTDTNLAWVVDEVSFNGRTYSVFRRDAFPGPGSLDGVYSGRTAWRFIVFKQHDAALPLRAEEIDLGAMLNYVQNNHSVTGSCHVVNVELGVEPHYGTFDMEVFNYRVYR